MLNKLKIPGDYNLVDDGITQSTLLKYTSCRVAFLFFLNKLSKHNSLSTGYGSLWHVAMETLYTQLKIGGVESIDYIVCYKAVRNEISVNDDYTFIDDEILDKWCESIKIMLLVYIKLYDTFFKKITIIDVEKEFRVKFPGHTRRGKIDLIYCYKNSPNLIYILDHKSKSQIVPATVSERITDDVQGLYYTTACDKSINKNVTSFVQSMVRNSDIAKGKSISVFCKTLSKAVNSKPDYYFVNEKTTFSLEKRKLFNLDVQRKIEEIESFLNGELQCFKNQNSCFSPFRCEHVEYCSCGVLKGYRKLKNFNPELES